MIEVQTENVSSKTNQIDGMMVVARFSPSETTVACVVPIEGLFLIAPKKSWSNGNLKSCFGSSTQKEGHKLS